MHVSLGTRKLPTILENFSMFMEANSSLEGRIHDPNIVEKGTTSYVVWEASETLVQECQEKNGIKVQSPFGVRTLFAGIPRPKRSNEDKEEAAEKPKTPENITKDMAVDKCIPVNESDELEAQKEALLRAFELIKDEMSWQEIAHIEQRIEEMEKHIQTSTERLNCKTWELG